jgi:hypothetical protein
MFEKVDKAYFAQSKVLNSYMQDVEDLYARHVQHGNRKKTLERLRNRTTRPGNYSGSSLRCGLLFGIGFGFAIQGVIYGAQLQSHSDPATQIKASFLLQVSNNGDCWARDATNQILDLWRLLLGTLPSIIILLVLRSLGKTKD